MLTDVTYGVNPHVLLVSLRQLFGGLRRHHVRGIPLGPVLLALPSALLVLAVDGLRTRSLEVSDPGLRSNEGREMFKPRASQRL